MTVMHQSRLALAVVAALSVLGAASASASVIYTYTGNDFSTASGPYTTSESVTGSVTLSTPLADNSLTYFPVPTAFSFTDGVDSYSKSTVTTSTFEFETNNLGIIVYWLVELQVFVVFPIYDGLTSYSFPGLSFDEGYTSSNGGVFIASNRDSPGSWTSAIAQTPLPAALPLFATGLGVTGLLAWRRKKKAAIAA